MLKSFDPLLLHLFESLLRRRTKSTALSFGESLDGTRDILLVGARDLPDLLAVVPAARALRQRFRLARVHVLAAGSCGELLAGRPEVFEVMKWDPGEEPILSRSFLERVRRLRGHPFDLAVAIDSGEARLARAMGVIAGAKLRLGIHPEGADPTLNLVVASPPVEGYRPVQSLEFLAFLGIPRERLTPSWEIPDKDRKYAERFLDLRRRGDDGWLLGVDPGMGRSGVRPGPEKLAWLVERIVTSRGAVPLILTDEPEDGCVTEFRQCLKTPVLEASSRGLRDVLSFLSCCDAFLSGNTNLFHFAVALDVPTVGLFGAGEGARWEPRANPRCRVLRWRPGERVREAEFLRTLDAVRGADLGEMPLRLSLEERPGSGGSSGSAGGDALVATGETGERPVDLPSPRPGHP